MLSWGRFGLAAPTLAAEGRTLLYQTGLGLALLGTVRSDGGPRVHPVSPILTGPGPDGGLYALLTVSPKLGDLVRDGRYALHSIPAMSGHDALFLSGRVRFPAEPVLRAGVAAAYLAERGLTEAPPPGFARQTLVEFLVGACALSRAGGYFTWASSSVRQLAYTSNSYSE